MQVKLVENLGVVGFFFLSRRWGNFFQRSKKITPHSEYLINFPQWTSTELVESYPIGHKEPNLYQRAPGILPISLQRWLTRALEVFATTEENSIRWVLKRKDSSAVRLTLDRSCMRALRSPMIMEQVHPRPEIEA